MKLITSWFRWGTQTQSPYQWLLSIFKIERNLNLIHRLVRIKIIPPIQVKCLPSLFFLMALRESSTCSRRFGSLVRSILLALPRDLGSFPSTFMAAYLNGAALTYMHTYIHSHIKMDKSLERKNAIHKYFAQFIQNTVKIVTISLLAQKLTLSYRLLEPLPNVILNYWRETKAQEPQKPKRLWLVTQLLSIR